MELVNDSGLSIGWFLGRVPPHALSATVFVKGTFRIQPGASAAPLPAEEQPHASGDVHRDEDPARSVLYSTDFAMYKPRTDLLLTGVCHPPNSKPVPVCPVRFQVGAWSKSLVVVGDRRWETRVLGAKISDPVPFARMDLDYEHAFGGPGFPENPGGVGFAEEFLADGSPIRRLPNVEIPDRLVVDPKGKYPPAGFGPLLAAHPARMSRVGTFDARWLKERWPWFPDDFDWTYFNAAPADQQLEGFLRGDEPVVLESLHPAHPRCETRLPGLRPRWFAILDGGAQPEFREVRLHLDTLQIDAEAGLITLVWRGVTAARTKMLKEFTGHFIVTEPLTIAALPAAHYEALLPQRKAEMAEAAEVKPVSLAPLVIPPVEPPPLDWVAELEKEVAEVELNLKKQLEDLAARQAALASKLKARGIVLPAAAPPPAGDDDGAIAIAQLGKAYAAMKASLPAQTAHLVPPVLSDFRKEMPKDIPEPPPLPKEEAGPTAWTRERCQAHAAAKGSFDGQDLGGVDLSGLDFSGLAFREAVMEGANLEGSRLIGCDLAGAVLASVNLEKASLARADFTRAVLAGARLKEADLTGAILKEADCAGADLSGATLREAVLDLADLSKAVLAGADLSYASAVEAGLAGADLTGARAPAARLHLADFGESLLGGADLTQADLSEASLVGARGAGVRMPEADLSRARAAGADFSGGEFARIKGAESVWEGAVLDGANFVEARLFRANFVEASLRKASFFRGDLRYARLRGAVLEDAHLNSVNLFRGTLEDAVLTRCDLRASNLYEVEFLDARLDGARLDFANVKGSKLG